MNLLTEKISKSFDGKPIISDISISVGEGETVCLLGKSGIGKTTLFNIIAGVSRPDSGQILLSGEDITGNAGKVSYMLQKDLLMPYKSVLENIALPLIIKGSKKKDAFSKALEYFDEFGLSGTEDFYPSQLSGGMRQRAALLRTYLFSQGLILLDEPFSSLDTFTKSSMHEWFNEFMSRSRISALIITHDIDEAILLSDRIYIMTGNYKNGIPGRIAAQVVVDLKNQRDSSLSTSREFINVKKEILKKLSENEC